MMQRSRGYTLIELIISIMLMGILSGLLAAIIGVNFGTMAEMSERKKLVTRGLLAVNMFQREAGSIKSTNGISIASDTQIRFTDVYGNTWEYLLNGSELTRQQVGVGSAQILATPINAANSKFSYVSETNTDLGSSPTISSIRLIKLKLTMDDGASGLALLGSVYPENFKVYNR